ncbi:MAG: Panacea domain-containing protein [Terriglobia bacterium]
MSYVKLIKLLYLLDRESLLRWGRSVTTDKYVLMDKGPVVSRIYDLIRDEPSPNEHSVWRQFISPPDNYEVKLLGETGSDELSVAEEELIQEVFDKYGAWSRWQLVDYTHTLPEWADPEGSALPVEYRDILKAGGKTEIEIAGIEKELEHLARSEDIFQLR